MLFIVKNSKDNKYGSSLNRNWIYIEVHFGELPNSITKLEIRGIFFFSLSSP
jgi:hypothetical protein